MLRLLVVVTLTLACAGSAIAQGNIIGMTKKPGPVDPDLVAFDESHVGVIEPAMIRTMARVRVDFNHDDVRPSRAEYLFAKPVSLGGRGFAQPERNISFYDFTSYGEVALLPWFSTFVDVPYRWTNPDINANEHDFGNVSYGFKLCTWNGEKLLMTLFGRLENPTAGSSTGNRHWTFEPGLLAALRVTDQVLVEGELRYWIPLNGSDASGDILRYGLGVSYGQRSEGFWFAPVVEGVGWSVFSGESVVVTPTGDALIQDASGQTIFNGYAGLRWGLGQHFDSYIGYGRCFTGSAWQRDFLRVEVRFLY